MSRRSHFAVSPKNQKAKKRNPSSPRKLGSNKMMGLKEKRAKALDIPKKVKGLVDSKNYYSAIEELANAMSLLDDIIEDVDSNPKISVGEKKDILKQLQLEKTNIEGDIGEIQTRIGRTGDPLAIIDPESKYALKLTTEDMLKTFPDVDDVIGMGVLKESMQTNLIIARDHPDFAEALGVDKTFLMYGPSGTGKCITGDAYVFTNEGMIQIGSIFETKENESSENYETIIESFDFENNFPAKTSHIYQKKDVKIKKISTHIGINLNGTPHHRIVILSKEGNLIWKHLSELSPGDIIPIRSSNLFPSTDMAIPQLEFRHHSHATNQMSYKYPKKLNAKLAYIMGLLVGDGSFRRGSKNNFSFSNSNVVLNNIFKTYMEELYDKTPFIGSPYQNRTVYDLIICSTEIRQHLLYLGLTESLAYEKEVPFSILKSSAIIQCNFLKGLFDADGYIGVKKQTELSYSSSSEKLIIQIQMMMLNLGIISRKRKKITSHRNHWVLTIYNDFIELYADLIGFNQPDKNKRLIIASSRENKNTNINIIPHISQKIKSLWNNIPLEIRSNLGHTRRKGAKPLDNVKYRQFEEYIQGSNIPPAKLKTILFYFAKIFPPTVEDNFFTELLLLTEGYFFTTINSINEGYDDVFDFVVPKTHSFNANGIINHNTELAKAMAKKLDIKFMYIESADILDENFGQSEKNVRDLFEFARKNKPTMIFFDEIDQLTSTRSGKDSGVETRVKTALLTQMEGFGHNDKELFILGATNRPWALDPAVKSRFSFTDYAGLPTSKEAGEMVKRIIENPKVSKFVKIEDLDYDKIGESFEGFAGREIRDMVRQIISKPGSEMILKTGTVDLENIRPITMDEFSNKAKRTKKKVTQAQLKQFADYHSDVAGESIEIIEGGLADNISSSKYDKTQLKKGIKVEMEHTDDPEIAKEITKDHLEEHPKYYVELEKMEKKLEKPVKKSKSSTTKKNDKSLVKI